MIPNNRLSSRAVVAATVAPAKGPTDYRIDWEYGGVALNDPSQGLQVKLWTLEARDVEIDNIIQQEVVLSAPGVEPTVLFTGKGITEVSLAFDQNMRPFVAYVKEGIPYIYWYDTQAEAQVVTQLPEGAITPRCCTDEKRNDFIGNSDIILAYVRNSNLIVCYQRERYQVEHIMAEGCGGYLVNVAMNTQGRLQFRMRDAFQGTNGLAVGEPFLGDVVEDVCRRSGLPPNRVDVSQLYEDHVKGYKIGTETTGAGVLGPLQSAYFFDPVERDGVLHFVKRGGPVVASLSYQDLAMNDPNFKVTRVQEKELLKKLTLRYIDSDAGYVPSAQTAQRRSNTLRVQNEATRETPLVFDPDTAARIADVQIKVAWYEQQQYEFDLTVKHSDLTPTDVVNYTDREGNTYRMRITRISEDTGRFKVEAIQDLGPYTYSSRVEGGNSVAPPVDTKPGEPGETIVEVLDIPLIRDRDDELGVYVAVRGTGDGWTGAVISYGYSVWDQTEVEVTTASTMGTTVSELQAENPLYQDSQDLVVSVNDELESISQEALGYYGNLALVGNEIIQFKEAIHLGSGQYLLRGLIRGRKNTKAEFHPKGERFVLLDQGVRYFPIPKWFLDKDITISAVSFGAPEGQMGKSITVRITGVSQREWAPYYVKASRDGSTVTVSWIGRARLGVEVDPYHSRHFRGYRVRFSDGYTIDTTDTSVTRANTPVGVTVSVAGVNELTGVGDYSEEVPT